MAVLFAGHEAVDSWRTGDPHLLGPEPREARHVNNCRFLDHGTSTPAGCRQVFWQVRLRQAARQEQPAVVGDDPDFPPARGQQRLNAVHQAGDQFGNPMGQPAAFLVADGIQIAELRPGAAGGAARVGRRQHLVAFILQQLAETVDSQVFPARIDAGPKLVAPIGPRDLGRRPEKPPAWRSA